MKLTAFTDYSLRVLIYLAAAPSRKATIAEIARAYDISEHHLVKVVHFLGRSGWVTTLRGKGGGLTLTRDPGDICIGRVVRDTEGALAPAECFETGGGRCVIGRCCQLKDVLAQAIEGFYAVLDRYTLADVAANSQVLSQVLRFHPAPAPSASA
jgi:Rrf2 family transcriptional regulator, nitric oxide-sensitive transcriptional repressor